MTNPSAQSPYPVTTQRPAKLGQLSSAEMQTKRAAAQLAWLAGICAALSPPAAFKKAQTHTSQKVHVPPMRCADHPRFKRRPPLSWKQLFTAMQGCAMALRQMMHQRLCSSAQPCCKPALPLEFRSAFPHCFALFQASQAPLSLLFLLAPYCIFLR